MEARSSDRRSNVENAPRRRPITGEPATPTYARNFENAPVTRQSAVSSARRTRPAGRSHYVVISRDGRKLVTRLRCYVAIATQPVHRLQIRPIVHNWGAASTTPTSYIRVRAVVWAYGRGQTDRQTHRRA